MNKNKKILYYSVVLFIILCVVFAFQLPKLSSKTVTNVQKTVVVEKPTVPEEPVVDKTGIDIKKIQEVNQNTDVVAYIKIPDVMESTIVQANDNEYYLRRLLDGSYSIKGTPFMDYRTTFEDRKILIYGHSGNYDDLAFVALHQYEKESFYKEHSNIYLYSMTKKYTYEIFSSYLETSDYDYVNIKSFRGLSWLEHINKLKNKSNYQTNVSLSDNSKILILQTCDMENLSGTGKYRLVIGVLTKIEDNIYE